VTAETDYLFYDGGKQFTQVAGGVTTPLLPRENVIFAQAGYYFAGFAVQPFLRFERLHFQEARFESANQRRYCGGANWYVSGQNLKVTAFYERIVPETGPATAAVKNTNHFAVQLQFFYF
ncbi:MAG TPA: porin, partial [Thermoanaerobaculia bacterium]|nr:porin [Thermoanaerobaculia bacterium]